MTCLKKRCELRADILALEIALGDLGFNRTICCEPVSFYFLGHPFVFVDLVPFACCEMNDNSFPGRWGGYTPRDPRESMATGLRTNVCSGQMVLCMNIYGIESGRRAVFHRLMISW